MYQRQYCILIVDDEEMIRELLSDFFSEEGYRVLTAQNAEEAMHALGRKPDLVLLDINMPGTDGLTFCRQIRRFYQSPILFLTARGTDQDQIQGLRMGGDDYIMKPFHLDVLAQKVKTHLIREERSRDTCALGAGCRIQENLVIDYDKHLIYGAHYEIEFSKTEFEIIELLSLHPGQIFDKERIYESVRGFDGKGDSQVIKEHIRKIRQKLSAGKIEDPIKTVWGVGYTWEK